MDVDQEKDLRKLREAYDALETGGFQVRFIIGKTGMGKTSLLDRFLEEVEGKDEKVLATGSICTIAGEDYRPFKDILQQIVQELTVVQEGKKGRKEKWRKIFGTSADVLLKVAPDLIGEFVPLGGVINAIGEKVLGGTGIEERVNQMKGNGGMLSDVLQLSGQYLEVLKLIAGEYRLIIYLDHLQWADRASLELLQRLQAGLKRYPVLFIGCYRSTDVIYGAGKERHPLETFVTHVKVSYGDIFVDLDRRSSQEREEWTDCILESEKVRCSCFFRNELFRRTGGNPLYVTELLHMMKENGSLVKDSGEGWMEGKRIDWKECPVRIEGVVREDIAGVEPDKMEVLRCAAVQGQYFCLQVLARVMGMEEMALLDCLTGELGQQRHLVYEGECFRLKEGLISMFCFSDVFLQGYLYQGLGTSRQMMLHLRVGSILEELYAGREEEICFELAWHYECGGEDRKALHYLDICVGKTEKSGEYGRMKEFAERALRLEGKSAWGMKKLQAMRKSGRWKTDELQREYEDWSGKTDDGGWFWEQWNILMFQGKLQTGLKVAESFSYTAEGKDRLLAELACKISLFWLGGFSSCLEGDDDDLMLSAFYRVLSAFQCGESGMAESICQQLENRVRENRSAEEQLGVILLRVWLAFLDEDMERMKEGLKDAEDMKKSVEGGRCGKWLGLFETFLFAETEVWKGLEAMEQKFRELGEVRGVTLYGLMVCRICFAKGLYEIFDGYWKKVVEEADRIQEKAYLGELYLLKRRRLEIAGRKKEAEVWHRKMQGWAEETGGWIPDLIVG